MTIKKVRTSMAIITVVFSFLFFANFVFAGTVNNTGTYVSDIYDTAQVSTWGTISWAASDATGTLTVKVRSCDDAACSGETAIASCAAIASSGDDISSNGCVTDTDRYIQYQVDFNKDFDDAVSDGLPTLNSMTINYTYYASGYSSLISSKYDASSGNAIGGIQWSEDSTLPSGTEVAFYVRTASTELGLDSATWTGIATSTPSTLTNGCTKTVGSVDCPISTIPSSMKDGVDDEWYQYKVKLYSNGVSAPSVDDIQISYIVNSPPNFNGAYGTNGISVSQDSSGTVNISYSIRDVDTETDLIIPSFEYYNGSSWVNIVSGLSSGSTDAKAVNPDGVTYTTHSLTWDPTAQVDGTYVASAQIRITADDQQLANNTVQATSGGFVMDAKDPVLGAIPIIINATSTPALVTLSATDDTSLDMKVGLESDLSDALWESYSSTKTLTLSTDPDIVYAQFRDSKGNTSVISNYETIETPQSMMVQDTSNVSTSEYNLFIAWQTVTEPTAGFNEYRVLRSTDDSTYSIIDTITTSLSFNYYRDTSVSNNVDYYYKVALIDDNGNSSFLTTAVNGKPNGTQDAGEGGGGTETTAPTISNVTIPSSTIYTTEATVLWDTNELSDSTVRYITATGGDFSGASSRSLSSFMDNSTGYIGEHSVVLSGLSPATTYYLEIQSTDPSDNIATSTQGVNGYSFTTKSGPQIANDPVYSDVNNDSVDIGWTTDINSDSYVVYSASSDMSGSSEVGQSESVTDHTVSLTGLTTGQKYYFYIKSGNATRKNTVDGVNKYYTFTTASDVTAPTISSVGDTSKRTSSVITWTTDEQSTSKVEYGLTGSYGSTESSATMTRKHSVSLSGIDPNTTYYYQVISVDGSNNYATSTGHTLTTEEFKISDVTSATVSETSNTITWSTNESATSQVEYSTSSDLSGSTSYPVSPSGTSTSHSVTLSGLSESTTYYYRASSTSNGTTVTSPIHYFSTGDTTAPVQSSISVPLYTDDSATITWNTDESATSIVKYGTTSVSDPTATDYDSVSTSSTLTRLHSHNISSLTSGTVYYYRVITSDGNSNRATSTEQTFTTLSAQIGHPDLTEPDNPTVTQYSDDEAVLSLTTNTSATSKLCYSTSPITVDVDSCPAANLVTITDATRVHSFHLSGLNANTTYYTKVKTTDSESGVINFTSGEVTFETLGTQVASDTFTCPPCIGGGGITKVCPTVDETRPVISKIFISEIGPSSTTIEWNTNESSNELVTYGTSANLDDRYSTIRGRGASFSTDHSVPISNLDPGTKYFYKISSADKSGNISQSETFSFTTLSGAEGVAKEIERISEEVGKVDVSGRKEAESLLTASLDKVNDIIQKFSGVISVDTLESSVKESVQNIESLIPSPVMHGDPIIEIEESKVTIKWMTDKESNSIVLFVPEDQYDPASSVPYLYQTGDSGASTIDHEVDIPNLLPETTYHYQVSSKSAVGSAMKSGNFTFTTEREVPRVTFSQIQDITDFTASITWTTSIPTDSLIKYTPYDEDLGVYVDEESQVQGKTELVKNHLITIENLKPGTTYAVDIEGRDEAGASFTYSLGNLNTSKDVRSPQIMSIKTESSLFPNQKEKVQTIISWNTDEESTSQIAYIESGRGDGLTRENIIKAIEESRDPSINKNDITESRFKSPSSSVTLTRFDPTMSKRHISVITFFKPSTVYKFVVISVDPSGNVSLSDKYVTMTPQQSETVLEMVIKTFEDRFKWIKGGR